MGGDTNAFWLPITSQPDPPLVVTGALAGFISDGGASLVYIVKPITAFERARIHRPSRKVAAEEWFVTLFGLGSSALRKNFNEVVVLWCPCWSSEPAAVSDIERRVDNIPDRCVCGHVCWRDVYVARFISTLSAEPRTAVQVKMYDGRVGYDTH